MAIPIQRTYITYLSSMYRYFMDISISSPYCTTNSCFFTHLAVHVYVCTCISLCMCLSSVSMVIVFVYIQ
jgi:hypothetical protein